MSAFSFRRVARLFLGIVGLGACVASEADAPPDPVGPPACPVGHVSSPTGACMAVGIQGCADVFVDDDRLCRPSIERCAAGTIPIVGEGCAPVGIPTCAAAFLEDDGLYHPAMTKCPEGSLALPLEGCVPIDGPDGCGEGTWGTIPDGPDTLWVDPAAAAGGDGTKGSPVTTIAVAVAKAVKGGRVVLAAGDYDEPIVLTKALEIVGRCASMVRVRGTSPLATPPTTLVVDAAPGAARPTVRNVTFGKNGGVAVLTQSDLTLDRVVIDGASGYGVAALGPVDVELSHTLIRGTLPLGANAHGRAVVA
ncbi:MAG: hypothetical protein FJ096_20630 [Deltaproteobacteria bacterium]|nr:hypothetical protein [Deltaproteobacteria bacterium]